MASKIDKIKAKIGNDILSETELENLMVELGYVPLSTDDDAENLIKFTNYKCQIWIDVVRDGENNLLCENVRQVTKEKGEETKVEPITRLCPREKSSTPTGAYARERWTSS